MNASRRQATVLAVLFALTACGGGGGGSPAPAPAPSPVSSSSSPAPAPVVVNVAAGGTPYVAPLANGNTVVVWSSQTSGQGQGAVQAQVLDPGGGKVGDPVTVFAGGSTNSWMLGGVGALPDGSFLVAASAEVLPTFSGPLLTREYVQKVSASGQLVATGGASDPNVNGGLADFVISENQSDTIFFFDARFFVNADSSYSLAFTRQTHPVPNSFFELVLVNVDAAGNVQGSPVELSGGYSAFVGVPNITRLANGNFLEAGTSTTTYAPVVWRVITPAGAVVAQQSLGAAPGNSTSDAKVTTLSDGTGLLAWAFANSATSGWAAERVDGSGNVVQNQAPPPRAGYVTGLAHGGYVQTWLSGTQLMAQYFTSTGQAVGDAFLIAGNVTVNDSPVIHMSYSVAATLDGFVAAYAVSTSSGQQVQEARFTAPPLT